VNNLPKVVAWKGDKSKAGSRTRDLLV